MRLSWKPAPIKGGTVVIGNFDGVHRGHSTLLNQLVAGAHERGLVSCVLTFEPHPKEFFSPEQAQPRILNLRDKLAALAEHKTQLSMDAPFFALSDDLGKNIWGYEYYTQVKGVRSANVNEQGLAVDLFS